MEKKIEDYLHLYPNAIVYWGKTKYRFISIVPKGYIFGDTHYRAFCIDDGGKLKTPRVCELKIELRHILSMTEQEAEETNTWIQWTERNSMLGQTSGYDAEQIRLMLSKHFDLFGLIESGLALDSTKQHS